ncbi:MAG: hypothetical protein J6038_01515, partial [Bacilli bacterium]|nr:hypothetical protein [Bacilli bacterium]
MMRTDLFLYKVPQGEDILANDGSSFSAPTFALIGQKLRGTRSLSLAPGAKKVPLNYDEDMVQANRRDEFDFKDWVLAACSCDGYGNPKSALLIHQHHLEEGMVLSFPSCAVEVCFYRGFLVEEFPNEAPANGEDFLYSIGVKEEYAPLSETYNDLAEDDEEAPIIEVVRPKFTANKKHKILDLGGNESEAPEVVVDEEENLEIHVERPAFSANSKKKIADLGYSGQPAHSSKKAKKILEEEELEEEEAAISAPSVERSAFEARSNKKPQNLDARPRRKPTPAATPAP